MRLGGVGPVSVEEMKPDWETPEGRGGRMFEGRQEPFATLWRFAAFLQIEGGREEVETEEGARLSHRCKSAAKTPLVGKKKTEKCLRMKEPGWNYHFSAPGPALKCLLFCPPPYSPP